MSKKVFILQGISGSGKSTYAKQLKEEYTDCRIVSADTFFYGDDGSYNFNPAYLKFAHGECLLDFIDAMLDQASCVVVDNTNTTVAEVAPYYGIAEAYGYEATIVYIPADPNVCAKRNIHSVPIETCKRMAERIKDEVWPDRWQRFMYILSANN